MDVAYAGEEEKIHTLVAETVKTYRPAGEHGTEYKGTAYAEQMERVTEKKSDMLVAV